MNKQIRWQKSSFSGANGEDCVEIARCNDDLLVRESDESGLVLTTTPARLRALMSEAKTGRFDRFM